MRGQPDVCRLVSMSIFADPKPLKILPEYCSIENPLRSKVPKAAEFREPENEGDDLVWTVSPKSLTLSDWIYGVAIGDFEHDPTIGQTVARTVVTLIPVIDQIGDLQDLTASVYHLIWKEEYNKPFRWLALTLTLVGCFPEAGTAVKGVLDILRRAVGERLPQVVRFLNLIANGNAIKWLWKLKNKLGNWTGKLVDLFAKVLSAIRGKLAAGLGWIPGVKRVVEVLDKVRRMADQQIARAIDKLAALLENALIKEGKRFEITIATGRKYTVKQARQTRRVLTAAERKVVPGPKGKRPYNQSFRRKMLRRILEDDNHPLQFLVVRGEGPGGKELRGRWLGNQHFKRGLEDVPAVEIGHARTNWAHPNEERLMLQDPESNALAGLGEARGDVVYFDVVEIAGVPVERATALRWERISADLIAEGRSTAGSPYREHLKQFSKRLGKPVKDLPSVNGWLPP